MSHGSLTECPCLVCGKVDCAVYQHSRQHLYKKRRPWVRFVEWARRRCNDMDPKGPNYWTYAAKGIVCKLKAVDLELAWERDGAVLMKRPSLDRIDPDKSYTKDNIRFVEWYFNIRSPHSRVVADEVTPEFT